MFYGIRPDLVNDMVKLTEIHELNVCLIGAVSPFLGCDYYDPPLWFKQVNISIQKLNNLVFCHMLCHM